MTKSFREKETEKLFKREYSKIPPNIQSVALRKLGHLDAAKSLQDLRVFPGHRLEALKGDRAGQHSIRINDQWRICFVWLDGDAYEVEIRDCH
ncbi:MAG: type II toxin-antitoxin system RelE/ParE family toxin [Deltaproteobacteria bacterium]|nr:type II toxin-antitoxin system RelE/ParE family toxin [Deltaproteobacteria bacterium]